jgi:prolyl-tRNA editing enzyme YbaK/EbsC (Cys-tRNA(Pro) deacylase)
MSLQGLTGSASKVQRAADALGLPITVREMDASTRTAEEAAAACGVVVGQIVKSLVFVGAQSSAPYLILVAGHNRGNEKAMAAQLGEKLRRPDADAVRAITGYAIGGIPPFGHDQPLATYMDGDLLTFDVVWAAAGTPRAVFSVAPSALRDATKAKVVRVI